MATTAKLTVDEFLTMPESKPGSEYIDGEVLQKTMPNVFHMLIQQALAVIVGSYIQRLQLGICGPEGRCVFGPPDRERGLLPDYLFLRAERLTEIDPHGTIRCAPDLAVEILSPDNRMIDVMRRPRFYLSNGVRLVWLIDPDQRTLTMMTAPDIARILTDDDTLDGGDLLPGFSCPIRDILPPAEMVRRPRR